MISWFSVTTIFFILLFQLNQAIGSIQAIAKASKEYIENTDLSSEKVENGDQVLQISQALPGSQDQLID